MNFESLTNKIITSIEMLAEDYGSKPGSANYPRMIRRISKILDVPAFTVDMVLSKNIGEIWKKIADHPTYKISNFGRVIGRNGHVLSTYIDSYGREIVDPQTDNGKHKHLHIRSAVIKAFIKPRKGQKVEYLHGNKINTIYNLGIV